MTAAWLYLFLASALEVCWIYNLKVLDMKKVMKIRPSALLHDPLSWEVLLPFLGYIFFGLTNVMAMSKAMKIIPAGTAFAVWFALAIIATKLFDIVYFKESYNFQQIFFMFLIIIGVIGLKWFE